MTSRKAVHPTMNVVVTVKEPHRDHLEVVASKLKMVGMNVADTIQSGGIIVGDVSLANLAKLHAVDGIQAIEEEPIFHADR